MTKEDIKGYYTMLHILSFLYVMVLTAPALWFSYIPTHYYGLRSHLMTFAFTVVFSAAAFALHIFRGAIKRDIDYAVNKFGLK